MGRGNKEQSAKGPPLLFGSRQSIQRHSQARAQRRQQAQDTYDQALAVIAEREAKLSSLADELDRVAQYNQVAKHYPRGWVAGLPQDITRTALSFEQLDQDYLLLLAEIGIDHETEFSPLIEDMRESALLLAAIKPGSDQQERARDNAQAYIVVSARQAQRLRLRITAFMAEHLPHERAAAERLRP